MMASRWRQRSLLTKMQQIAGTMRWICGRHDGRLMLIGGKISKEVAGEDGGKRAQGSLTKHGGSIAVQLRFFFFFFKGEIK